MYKKIKTFPKIIKTRGGKILSNINKHKNIDVNFSKFTVNNLIQNYQDKIEKIFSSDVNKVVLKQSKFWASAITWVLIGGSGFAIGWICIAETDEIVIATGKLEPKGGVVDVQMPLEGVASEIMVSEGERVKKGQLLIKLDTEFTASRLESQRKNLIANQNILEKLRYLVSKGAVSELQLIQQEILVEKEKSEIKANEIRTKYQKILSPIDGTIFQLVPKGAGFVAQTSQPVLQIVPSKNLLAKIEIDSRTIGFVKVGKTAEISIDSFPSSDFGVVKGKLTSVGSDALPPNPSQGKGYRFPAEVTLENQYLLLKSGEKLPLQAGMSLSANIKLRKVTYIQLLLTKFNKKKDSLKSI